MDDKTNGEKLAYSNEKSVRIIFKTKKDLFLFEFDLLNLAGGFVDRLEPLQVLAERAHRLWFVPGNGRG